MKNKQTVTMAAAVIVLAAAIGGYFGIRQWNKAASEKENVDTSIDIVAIDETEIEKFSYVYEDETITFVKTDGIWYYDADRNFPVKQSSIEGKLSSVAGTNASRKLTVDESALAQYGLDMPVNTIVLYDGSGQETVLEIGDVNDSTGEYYCRLNRSDKVYMITSSLKTMMSFDIYSVAEMDAFPALTADQIRSVSVSDGAHVTVYNNEDHADMMTAAAGLYYTSHVNYDCTDPDIYGLAQPGYEVTIEYTEGAEVETSEIQEEISETQAETKEEVLETLVLKVGDLADNNYYVQLEGSTQVHAMSASQLDTLLGIE